MKNKKAQGWGMDLIIAASIFSIGLVVFYIYSLNTPGEAKENLEILSYEGKILASTILSEGIWNAAGAIKIGILSNGKINDTKLQYFSDMVQTPEGYTETKRKFDIKYDYYFYLNGNPVPGIGKPGIDPDNIEARNLIKVTRYTVYNNQPISAYIYIWEE